MNRHERRAAEARARGAGADKGFDRYRAQARRAFPKVDDRQLGEAWMRSQAFTASGAAFHVIHKKGEPRTSADGDWTISLKYGPLAFKAVITPALFKECIDEWKNNIIPEMQKAGRHNLRSAARAYIIEMLVSYQHTDGDTAALVVAAVAWLAATSEVGFMITAADNAVQSVHYEITDIVGPNGERGNNFRLMLNYDPDDPTSESMAKAPPTTGKPHPGGPI
jgi:hypothetical protein